MTIIRKNHTHDFKWRNQKYYKGKYTRASEGLYCHHISEDKFQNLSDLRFISEFKYSYNYQKKEKLSLLRFNRAFNFTCNYYKKNLMVNLARLDYVK